MSLPHPTTASSPPQLDPRQVQAMDAPLIALTQQCNGDLRQLLYAFFSFLNRRTDFYLVPHPDDLQEGVPTKMGFAEGDAEKLLLAAFRQFPLRRIPKGGIPAGGPGTPKKSATNTGTTGRKIDSNADKKELSPPNESHTYDPTNKQSDNGNSAGSDNSNTTAADNKANKDDSFTPSNMKGVEYNEEGLQIPVGNGGSTPRYKWTQTLDEITVLVGIPKNLHGKDFNVLLTPTRISVKANKPPPGEDTPRIFVEGELIEKIRVDESTWTVEGGVMVVTLDKLQKKFWSTVIVGDEKIDTELVDSRRHISDYDESTQAQIRKIIFDQNQYHKGLPSSDEILGTTTTTTTTTTTKNTIPNLPPGVEYIDKMKLDEVDGKSK